MTDKKTSRRSAKVLAGVISAAAILVFLGSSSCSATVENRVPVNEVFPSVEGESLEGEVVQLPLDEPAVLLLGYVQDAQFDADRWLVGLLQAPPAVRILEVPTIRGLFPSALKGTIDSGMRSGIPSEDWQSVVTLYGGDAKQVVELTGNERPRNIRVLLVDGEGRVRWFHDRGFSAGKLLELSKAAEELLAEEG